MTDTALGVLCRWIAVVEHFACTPKQLLAPGGDLRGVHATA
jgi:hypothetical protein